jgi:hypothetical protein
VDCERQGRRDGRLILGVHVLEAEQLGECIANGVLIKSVQAAQDAAGLK